MATFELFEAKHLVNSVFRDRGQTWLGNCICLPGRNRRQTGLGANSCLQLGRGNRGVREVVRSICIS